MAMASKSLRVYKVRSSWSFMDSELCRKETIDEAIESALMWGSKKHGHKNITTATRIYAEGYKGHDKVTMDLLSDEYKGKLTGNSFARLLKADFNRTPIHRWDRIVVEFPRPGSDDPDDDVPFTVTLSEAYIR